MEHNCDTRFSNKNNEINGHFHSGGLLAVIPTLNSDFHNFGKNQNNSEQFLNVIGVLQSCQIISVSAGLNVGHDILLYLCHAVTRNEVRNIISSVQVI